MSQTNLDLALKTRVGDNVPPWIAQKILLECHGNAHYSTLATKCKNLGVRMLVIGGRRAKHVCFLHGDSTIPITKNRLYPRKPAVCTLCGSSTCCKKSVVKAFRDAIQDQILEFKTKIIPGECRCAISGTPLSLCVGGYHIDHVVPFSSLLRRFCKEQGINICNLHLKGRGQCKKLPLEIEKKWSDYHSQNARLQALCKKQNLRKGSKKGTT
jgi:hypothetical protein